MPIDRTSSSFTAKQRGIKRRNILFLSPSLGNNQPTLGKLPPSFFRAASTSPSPSFPAQLLGAWETCYDRHSFFESTRPLSPSTPVNYYHLLFSSRIFPQLHPHYPLLFPARKEKAQLFSPFSNPLHPHLTLQKFLCSGSVDIFLPPVVDRPPAETSSALSTCFHQVKIFPLLKLSRHPLCSDRADDTRRKPFL